MIPYSLHVAILLAICWLFYKSLLQKETYYYLNRLILLACLISAFAFPLISVPKKFSLRDALPLQSQMTSDVVIVESASTLNKPENNTADDIGLPQNATIKAFTSQNIIKVITWLYLGGVFLSLVMKPGMQKHARILFIKYFRLMPTKC